MKKLIIISVILLFAACQQKEEKVTQTIIDPNNTSEMALLMRDMFLQLEEVKNKIILGEDISKDQFNFELIHKQTPTDESFLKDGMESMSSAYAYSVQTFNEAPSSKSFISIVNNCMSCHTMLCPGPLERIDNLLLE
jgi:hypothetical protein|tara:strand:- start:332 stop:742 length:411 start_codon:yes stop_codon:yes gene_type:complete